MNRPKVISIAGFDPSAGAGVLSDVKTFEQHQVYGFGVCSALTVQNDTDFVKLNWLPTESILNQLDVLCSKFRIDACKIGIICSMKTLNDVVDFLKAHNPAIQIVFDPVLKASSGFAFHQNIEPSQLKEILPKITLITPNYNEMQLFKSFIKDKFRMEEQTNVLLKGGHNPDRPGVDILYEYGKASEITAGVEAIHQKHGSGCVLSSAITARLASGHTLAEACKLAKSYTENFLNSNSSLLGYHKL